MTRRALHCSATQDSKGAVAAELRSYPCDSQVKSGVFASVDACRYTARGAAFTVLRG
jgi:hypothetical protein